MAKRTADARWDGTLMDGSGQMNHGGGDYSGQYSFESRFEEGEGANPEELIGAAHAGCFSMNLSGTLEKEGHTPESIRTDAGVHLTPKDGGGYEISRIELHTRVRVAQSRVIASIMPRSPPAEKAPPSPRRSATDVSGSRSM